MRPLPTPPAPGKPVSATLIRQLIDAIRERTVLPGLNTSVKRGPNGTVVNSHVVGEERAATTRPWTFHCNEDPETHERTGGWTNCRLQIGLNLDITGDGEFPEISGTDQTNDGDYYCEVNVTEETAELKFVNIGRPIPKSDISNNKVNVYVGTVSDGKQTRGIYWVPVINIYL